MSDKPLQEPSKSGYKIKSLQAVIKDFESIVKDTDSKGRYFLIDGNNLNKKSDTIGIDGGGTFNMRYREAWGNWLLCATLSFAHNQEHVFQDDTTADGAILNKVSGRWFPVEHVSALTNVNGQELPKGEARILWAINKKIEKSQKNPGYAKGKSLLVFFDGAEKWYPNKVGRAINGTHEFETVYAIGLISTENNEYQYSVTQFSKDHSPSFTVTINKHFTSWTVVQNQ